MSRRMGSTVMDLIMFLFTKHICSPGYGQVRACADDVGAALRNLKDLIRVYLIFESVGKATGLHLKPAKCVLVLLSHVSIEHNNECVRAWLRANIPKWDNFVIANHGNNDGTIYGKQKTVWG